MKILEIKKINYNGDTYNLHVEDNHNYYANGLLVSNCHRYKSDVAGSIVKETLNSKIKLALTGTLPEDDIDKLELLGIFGKPKTYMTSKELIERGLGTPIKINSIQLLYNDNDRGIFRHLKNYNQQLSFIKEHEKRNALITNLSIEISKKHNTLILATHIEHMKTLYLSIMEKMYPDEIIENKHITGKNSFEFQKKYGIFYIDGSDDSKTRELTRKILDEDFFEIELEDGSMIRLHGNFVVSLLDGSTKRVKDLSENDDIDVDCIYLKNKN